MAQGTLTRLTYERLGILLTDAPAYKESGTKYTDLIRVQSMDYGFTHESLDVKAIGSDKLVTRVEGGQSPVVRAPSVNCNIEYFFSEGKNENTAGLYIGRDGSILSNIIKSNNTDDINILVVASHQDEHNDLNFLVNESDFEDYNIIGFGNAFLSNYSYNASIGSIPTCSLAYTSSNLKFDIYDQNDRPKLPSVKLGTENKESQEKLSLSPGAFGENSEIFSQYNSDEVSVVRPGDVKIRMLKTSGSRGGADLEYIFAAIQSISINLPIPRQDIYGMGSNYVFNRKLKLPIIGEMSVDMVLRGYDQDEVDLFLTEADVFDVQIDHPVQARVMGEVGQIYIDKSKLFIVVEENEWKNIAFAVEQREAGISGNSYVSIDSNFYYICIDGIEWAKIALVASEFDGIGYSVGDRVVSTNFIHVFTSSGWKKFAVADVDFDEMVIDDAFNFANNITFEINRAQLKSQNYTHSIGSEVMVSSSFTFDVTKDDGLRLYFRFVPTEVPSWNVKSETISYIENETHSVDLDDGLDVGDSKTVIEMVGADAGKFIFEDNKTLIFRSPPDYESQSVYNVRIAATNDAGIDYKNVRINIQNIVEYSPVWKTPEALVYYTENDDSYVDYVNDLDPRDAAPVEYAVGGIDKQDFTIDQKGNLSFDTPPDYESKQEYTVDIIASNSLGSTVKSLTIKIENTIDIDPVWTQSNQTIYYGGEDNHSMPFINDADPGDIDATITRYDLSGADSGLFALNETNDALVFNDAPQYNQKNIYNLSIIAYNEFGSAEKAITVYILGEFSFDGDYFVVNLGDQKQGRAAYIETTLSEGLTLDEFVDDNSDYYYVCINQTSWAKIALADSALGYTGYSIGDKVIKSDFVHILTGEGWKKFAITQQ